MGFQALFLLIKEPLFHLACERPDVTIQKQDALFFWRSSSLNRIFVYTVYKFHNRKNKHRTVGEKVSAIASGLTRISPLSSPVATRRLSQENRQLRTHS